MSLLSMYRWMAVSIVLIALPASQAQADLAVGSKAPKLDIEHWISNNGGKFPKVTTFEANKVYVVEFWATWCGPCVASMPHLAETQKKLADKGVQIISISDEDLETVEKFLGRPAPGQKAGEDGKPITFRELTATYCLTTDPDQSVYTDYMIAAKQSGIPTAFIVGKDGVVEWIGHPMEMDEPLEQVLEGKWDRQKYIKLQEERQAIETGMREVFALIERDRGEAALKKLDELIALASDPGIKARIGGMKIQVMMETNPEEAAKQLTDLIRKTQDVQALSMLSWQVVEMSMSDNSEVPAGLLNAAILAAEKAVKLAPKDGVILDTLSHLMHIQGNLDKAIELQKRAIELAPEVKELKGFLDQLEKEKAAK